MGDAVQDHLRQALRRLLKPLVRLLISQGMGHSEFSEAAKDAFVEMAIRQGEDDKKINRSQIAILTGLTRKEVKNVIDRTRNTDEIVARPSRPSRVLTGWFSDPDYTGPYGIPIELPYDATTDEEPCFVQLVRTYSGDMAPRQMLNELLRSGCVIEVGDGRYKAVKRDYQHKQLSPELIHRLGELGYRVFSTAATNIDNETLGHGYFDRNVFADEGCTDQVIKEFDKLVRVRGQQLLDDLDIWLASNNKRIDEKEPRKNTGLYMVHYVEKPDENQSLRELLLDKDIDVEA
ncbi:MAG TPA: DUF6502 family protein [Woeseiaceae bacterium]|nr:DUF6502 family protein [Woeseiaceae bacterium]